MEGFRHDTESVSSNVFNIEASANFEGSQTQILFERLCNPKIRQQLIDILYGEQCKKRDEILNDEWDPYVPEGWTGEEDNKLLKGKFSGKIYTTEELGQKLELFKKLTLETFEKEISDKIDRLPIPIEVNESSNGPDSSSLSRNWVVPWTGEKMSPRQADIFESHEKGHRVRQYDCITERLREGFDTSKVTFTQGDYDLYVKDKMGHTDTLEDFDKSMPIEEVKRRLIEEYLFTGNEIAERMSQLKNYFGFKGDGLFTKKHLDHARNHYIEDTNMDNNMRQFFEAITPETEGRFLELINSCGI